MGRINVAAYRYNEAAPGAKIYPGAAENTGYI